jgi:F-type H+-transporting ATPase subunit delta
MSTTRTSEVVRRYAVTLLEAADESGVSDAVAADLEGLRSSITASADLRQFLDNRLVDAAVAEASMQALFGGKVQGLTLNFLRLLARRRRVNQLPAIVDTALRLLAEKAGIATAEVRTATELTGEQVERLQERLSAHTGGRVQVDVRVDPDLQGGLVVRIGDTVFDGSVETQLRRLRARLATT